MKKKSVRERIDEILSSGTDDPGKKSKEEKLRRNLQENLKIIEDIIGFSDDIVIRRFHLGKKLAIEAAIIFVDGLIDKKVINENILKPLLIEEFSKAEVNQLDTVDIIKFLRNNFHHFLRSYLLKDQTEQSLIY